MREKNNRGITLVALVITIVVLIILATVAINMVFGENGLINRAEEAKTMQDYSTVSEGLYFKITDEYINKEGKLTNGETMDFLRKNNYINDDQEVNIEALLGQRLTTGNGKDGKDVYKIEEGVLYYCDNQGRKNKLEQIFNFEEQEEQIEATPEEYFDFDPETGTISLKGASYYSNMDGKEFPITEIVVPKTYKGQEVKIIGKFTYRNIKKVVIQEGVTKISSSAFKKSNELEEVKLPNSLTEIGEEAFCECKNIRNITIPSKVTIMDRGVFLSWTSEQIINVELKEKPSSWDENWDIGAAQVNWIGK